MEITILVIQYLTVFLNHQNNYLNLWWKLNYSLGFSGGSDGKESACNAGDLSSIPESGKIPGEGNRNPLQYSCLENPWTEEPGGLQSMGLQRVDHALVTKQQQIICYGVFLCIVGCLAALLTPACLIPVTAVIPLISPDIA